MDDCGRWKKRFLFQFYNTFDGYLDARSFKKASSLLKFHLSPAYTIRLNARTDEDIPPRDSFVRNCSRSALMDRVINASREKSKETAHNRPLADQRD